MICEHTGPQGPCNSPKVDGSEYCSRHSDESDRIKRYRLSNPELREKFEHHMRADVLTSVREEIALLSAMVHDRLDMIQSKAERMDAFRVVRPALVDIVKCVDTLSKLERQADEVLGKEAIMWLRKEIVKILVEEADLEHSVIDRVAKRIAEAIANARNNNG